MPALRPVNPVRLQPPARRGAFTIVELLVVVSIITLLVALLLPAFGQARFTARVAICASNYHQWGTAVGAYANDWDGALPRQDIPQTTGLNTWDVSNEFIGQVYDYGVRDAEVFGCPTRPVYNPDGAFATRDDAIAWFSRTYGYFSLVTQNVWIPRKFGSWVFPSRQKDATAVPGDWPTTMTDPRAADRPIVSDLLGNAVGRGDTLSGGLGGHARGEGIESTNVLFLDGHAETRRAADTLRRYNGNWQNHY